MIAHVGTVYDAGSAAELKRAEIVAAAVLELIFYAEKETVRENLALVDVKRCVRRLYRAVMEDVDGTLESILADDTIGDYTIKHSLNVSILSMLVAKDFGLDRKGIIEIGTSALLHDVGKRYVGRHIIYKDSFLTAEEMNVVRKHTVLGVEHLRSVFPEMTESMVYGVLYHHERLNGMGYPERLREDIPDIARIIAAADVFEAYMAKRPYHEKRSLQEGTEFILHNEGIDQEVAKRLVKQFYRGDV